MCKLLKNILILGLIILYITTLNTSPASAQTSDNPLAHQALVTALADAKARLQQHYNAKQAIALTQTSEDKHGNVFQQAFSPTQFSKNELIGTWTTLKRDQDFSQSVNVSNKLLFNSERYNISEMKLISQTKSTWVFQLPNIISVQADGEDLAENQQLIDESIEKNLVTEIIISKQEQHINGLKIYAAKPFSPSFMAHIETFEIRIDLTEAWPNGPIISQNITQNIVGKFGWLFEINELVTTKLSNIVQVEIPQSAN